METPVEIDFQGMTGDPEIQDVIAKHVAQLEQRYGRVTACRVALKGPGGHHHTGGREFRLALPNGSEVNVERTPQADERHSDLAFAINDAFKQAAAAGSCSPAPGACEAAREPADWNSHAA
jgi:hypothetical protein